MEYQIEHGPVFTTLRFTLQKDEQIRAEAGAMVSMSPTIELEAKSAGKGLLGTFKAAVGGEALFASLYTAKEVGELILAPAALGDIIRLDVSGGTLFAQSGAYLAGTPGLELSTQGSLKAMISGEGLFLQKISGSGMVFLNSYGQILEKTLQSGEKYIVDTGHIVAFEATVQYQIKKAAKTLLSSIGTAEGLACEYTGPGKIWIQTRNLSALARLLQPLLPR